MSDLLYLLSIFVFLIGAGVMAWLLWLGIEGVYWLYCKITKQDY